MSNKLIDQHSRHGNGINDSKRILISQNSDFI